ncbi:MAG: hypothetical protein Q9223_004701 [Gallowayella weberi]
MGAKASTIPVLAAENSPASIRESPRWYIKKNQYHDAYKSLIRLRLTPLQAARDLYYIHAQVRLEEKVLGDADIQASEGKEHYSNNGRYASRFQQLFTIPRVRRATLAAFVVMIAQQMCGINIMKNLSLNRRACLEALQLKAARHIKFSDQEGGMLICMHLTASTDDWESRRRVILFPALGDPLLSQGADCLRAASWASPSTNKMQSPPESQWGPGPTSLSLSIWEMIVQYRDANQVPNEADIDCFVLEVNTLHTHLNLYRKLRLKKADKLEVEKAHLRDVDRLLHRCKQVLEKLLVLIKHTTSGAKALDVPWDLNQPTFQFPRAYISFFTRTLQMSLTTLNL